VPISITNHNTRLKLLCFVARDFDESTRAHVRELIIWLGSLRRWVNGPPRFVDSRDERADGSSGNSPVETVGGYLKVYSALNTFNPGLAVGQSASNLREAVRRAILIRVP
jgi:hypothetical protein